MAYTTAWDESRPLGSSQRSTVDDMIRAEKVNFRERVGGIFGLSAVDFQADPLVPKSLALSLGLTVGTSATVGTFLAVGTTPATAGMVRVPNNQIAVAARNAANNADVTLSKLTASDVVEIANAKVTIDSATGAMTISGTITTNTKFANNTTMTWRNQADTLDIRLATVDITNHLRIGDDNNAVSVTIGSSAKPLGFFGTLPGTTLATVSGAKGGNAALASLMTALAGYGLVIDTTT